ncbi:MAG: MG2 domain-containing protein [Prevotella sp.]|nr:MG2 domain-containing protein [Prevotella sp.]
MSAKRKSPSRKVVSSQAEKNSFDNPDFAFPRDVDANAEGHLSYALASHDDLQALRALVQISVARNLVSRDSVANICTLFAETSPKLSPPYSQLSSLLEARLYADIYNSNSWNFNSRVLPVDSVPADPMLWNGKMFQSKVQSLLSSALNLPPYMRCMPISLFSPLVLTSYASSDEKCGQEDFSLYDFIARQAINILSSFPQQQASVIPFGDPVSTHALDASSISLSPLDIAESLVAFHFSEDPESLAMGLAWCLKSSFLKTDEKLPFLSRILLTTKPCDAHVPVAQDYFNLAYSNLWSGSVSPVFADYSQNAKDFSAIIPPLDFYNSLPALASATSCPALAEDVKSLIDNFNSQALSFRSESIIYPNSPGNISLVRRNIPSASLLILRLPDSLEDVGNKSLDQLLPSVSLAGAVPLTTVDSSNPFIDTCTVSLPPLQDGRYVLTVSADGSLKSIFPDLIKSRPNVVNVSQISMVCLDNPDGSSDVYVVDGMTQVPVKGASLSFVENPGARSSKRSSGVTDSQGACRVPFKSCLITASYNGSRISDYSSNYRSARSEKTSFRTKIFTDLALYHPGDSLNFAAVLLKVSDDRVSPEPNAKLDFYLLDANSQRVDSISAVSDNFGRLTASFRIPDDGLLGSWSIEPLMVSGKNHSVPGREFFEVADYKSPTFFVAIDSISTSIPNTLEITGDVMTYSGMPLAGSAVDYKISFRPSSYWWRGDLQEASFGGSVTAGPDGKFSISLPTARLRGTRYEYGRFSVMLTATSPSGEVQMSAPRDFVLGNSLRLVSSIPQRICVSSDSPNVILPIKVYDLMDHPVVSTVNYRLVEKSSGHVVDDGTFESPNLSIPAKLLASGQYSLVAHLSSDCEFNSSADILADFDSIVSDFIVWRSSDKVAPIKTSLWLPVSEVVAPADARKVKVRVGSSYSDGWLLMVVADKCKTLSRSWVRPKGGIVDVDVPAPADNDRVFVTFSGMHNFDTKVRTVTIIPRVANQRLSMKSISFRNRIDPNSYESWKFRFLLDGNSPGVIPVIAVMSDKSLDAITPFSWVYSPSSWINIYNPLSVDAISRYPFYNYMNPSERRSTAALPNVNAQWNMYGYSLFGGYGMMRRNYKVRGVASANYVVTDEIASEGAMPPMAEVSMNQESAVVADLADAGAADMVAPTPTPDSEISSDSQSMRPAEMPLAFFFPSLSTDEQGYVSLDFDTPNYNTTWKLQVLGYYPRSPIPSSVSSLEAIASKRVMVSANYPSFLRSGDLSSLSATVFNNSDSEISATCIIEIFDAGSGEVFIEKSFSVEDIAPSANSVVQLRYSVPTNISSIGYRVVATSDGVSDGELEIVPVLPASSPVIDSKVFYLAPGEQSFSTLLPNFREDANVTLKFCANPIWYCVTALPDIVNPDYPSSLSIASAIFGNSVASGLMSKYPDLREGLRLAINTPDSDVLRSNLYKDAPMHIVALNNTPWVNDASSETLRLLSLSSLLDFKGARKTVNSLWKRLQALSRPDGGWSWCPGMESSFFMTSRVLYNLGMIHRLGFSANLSDMDKSVANAIGFCDGEYVRSYNQNPKTFNPESMLQYLYTRSLFSVPDSRNGFYSLRAKGIAAIMKGWKRYDVYDKATAAMLLFSEGHKNTAQEILRSLNQYSTYQQERGRWFDNLSPGFNGMPKLLTTARVLEAYNLISPEAPEVGQIRQWLVLQRETMDWGGSSSIAEVVAAILCSGTSWTSEDSQTRVSLDGKLVEFSKLESLTGAATVSLSAAEASSKTLAVSKYGGGPAWGGVISQYVAPISEVRAADVPDLSIEKNYYVVTDGADGINALNPSTLHVGDRVRVTLTVLCKRDMDYVALTDQRAACFAPVEQLSGYTCIDGLWCYRESANSRTSLFFDFLPKGKHVVSYDLFVTRPGEYSAGVAIIQSQYSPMQTSHTRGFSVSSSE